MRFTCNAEHTSTKSRPGVFAILVEEIIYIRWIKCPQDRNIILHKIVNSNGTQTEEPQSKHGGE